MVREVGFLRSTLYMSRPYSRPPQGRNGLTKCMDYPQHFNSPLILYLRRGPSTVSFIMFGKAHVCSADLQIAVTAQRAYANYKSVRLYKFLLVWHVDTWPELLEPGCEHLRARHAKLAKTKTITWKIRCKCTRKLTSSYGACAHGSRVQRTHDATTPHGSCQGSDQQALDRRA